MAIDTQRSEQTFSDEIFFDDGGYIETPVLSVEPERIIAPAPYIAPPTVYNVAPVPELIPEPDPVLNFKINSIYTEPAPIYVAPEPVYKEPEPAPIIIRNEPEPIIVAPEPVKYQTEPRPVYIEPVDAPMYTSDKAPARTPDPVIEYVPEQPIYSSERTEQPRTIEQVEFSPEPVIDFRISEPVRTAAPIYNSPENNDIVRQTILPLEDFRRDDPSARDAETIIENVGTVNEIRNDPAQLTALKVNVDLLLEKFDETNAEKIVEALQNKQPLSDDISEILVENKIVEPITKAEIKKRLSIFDRITAIVYNLIYN